MLSGGETSYVAALVALKRKDYKAALEQFEKAAGHFAGDKEFNICLETTRLLVAVKQELARPRTHERLDIEEVFSNG